MTDTKRCKTCGRTKPLDDFYRTKPTGHRGECKPCFTARTAANAQAALEREPERVRAQRAAAQRRYRARQRPLPFPSTEEPPFG